MLLRSITKHVKEQNWFAVALDFFIVVLGILIAFQITNWSSARQYIQQEKALIARLSDEFSTLEALLAQRIERAEGLVTNTADLIALIRSGDEPEDQATTKDMLNKTLRYSAAIPPPNAFSEALQSGRIGSLRDETLRRALYKYQISTEWWITVSGGVDPQSNAESYLLQAITLSADRDPEDFLSGRVLQYDWSTILKAEKELSVVYGQQSLQAEAYRLELTAVQNVLSALEN